MTEQVVHGRQRRSLDQWRTVVGRFQASGLSVAQFCAQEQDVSRARLNHWRRLLGTGSGSDEVQAVRRGAFVDAGVLGSAPAPGDTHAPVTVRIDLGGGVVLIVSRP